MNYYNNIKREKFKILTFNDIFLNPKNVDFAIIRDDFPGFKEDYISIHLIIKKYLPKTFIEIGTNSGLGTNIICNAMGNNTVYSLDLPAEYDMSLIYSKINPEDGRPNNIGQYCKFKYIQLWGNSKTFDFSKYYPLDMWFIDGKHNYEYTYSDTTNAINANANIIIWHDINIDEVQNAVIDIINKKYYNLYYIENTRIAFAEKYDRYNNNSV
jgi:predicted O-methyltransferase YrrM